VVASGFYQGEGTGLRLGEEFHHNRVRVVGSQIGGTPLPMGLRWNQRRLVTTVLEHIAAQRIQVEPLISDVMDAAEVAQAFELISQGYAETLQVVLRFPAAP
jgi:threonine dehydrogenase-like Zn-dependent dehydrogenase